MSNEFSLCLDKSQCNFHAAAAAKSPQLCPTLCDPIDGSPPGSPVPGILQARTLEWVAISFSNAWKWKVKVKSLSRVWPNSSRPHGLQPTRLLHPWDFPGKSSAVGCHNFHSGGQFKRKKKKNREKSKNFFKLREKRKVWSNNWF